MPNKAPATMTKGELANVAGYSYQRLYDINNTLDDDNKLFVPAADGKCDLAVFVQRWVRYNVFQAIGDAGTDLDTIKAQHEAVKKRKTEIEVALLEGRLLNAVDVRKLWSDIVSTAQQKFLLLPATLGPRLTDISSAEDITAMLDDEIRDILSDISEAPIPVWESTDETNDNDNEDTETAETEETTKTTKKPARHGLKPGPDKKRRAVPAGRPARQRGKAQKQTKGKSKK